MTDDKQIMRKINVDKALRDISNFIEYSLIESNTQGLVMGISGGLDSSTVATISAGVVNPEKILALAMPTSSTPPGDTEGAVELVKDLGIAYKVLDLDPLLTPVENICRGGLDEEHIKLAQANLKARMRMMVLYYHANALNRLVVGTSNRTELMVGYFTKYGDGGADILPLGDLYKTDVCSLAEHLDLPTSILEKKPTAGLWPGQTDEDDLGISYVLLDKILYLLMDKKLNEDDVALKLGISSREVVKVRIMVQQAQHKLKTPPIAQIEI
jgi:NAD+ synthase